MDDEKYMLRKSTKGFFVKLDADIFYQLLDYNLAVSRTKNGKPYSIDAWKPNKRFYEVRPFKISRFIMNAGKNQIVDHINRDIFDNRRCNLRFVTYSQNNLNHSQRKKTFSFYGVSVLSDRKGKIKYIRSYLHRRKKSELTDYFQFSVIGIFFAALAHDKLVIQNKMEEYASLNFSMFKIPRFRKVLLNTDIKLLRSIYLGKKE